MFLRISTGLKSANELSKIAQCKKTRKCVPDTQYIPTFVGGTFQKVKKSFS